MKGESKSYTWEHGYPVFDLPEANIQFVQFKSEYKPFLIFREGGGFDVFNLEVRPEYSHFPWWNHWPVAQIVSDGRSAFAPDRTAHSSLSWGDPNGEAALYGMTNKDPQTLVALARSWNYPAELKIDDSGWKSDGYKSDGYDYTQRAYILETDSDPASLGIVLQASKESPVVNAALVLQNWSAPNLSLELDGKSVPQGKYFRYGLEYDVDGKTVVVVWIRYKSEKPVKIVLKSNKMS
jgi:hypothetical protein